MEDVMKPLEETETEVLEEGLRQRQARRQRNTSTVKEDGKEVDFTGLENGGLDFSPPKMNSGEEELDALAAENLGNHMNGEIYIQQEEIEKIKILPDANPISEGSNSSNNVTSEGGNVSLIKEIEQEVRELYLERVYQKPETHAFYCPNCRACIEKVLIQNQELENTRVAALQRRQIDTFRCSSCFSFLIPIGSWLFPRLIPKEHEAPIDEGVPGSSNHTKRGLPDQTAKDGPENQPPETDKSVRLSQSVARNPSELAFNTVVDSGNQVLKLEQVITDGANKVATEVGDKITDLGTNIEKDIKVTNSSIHLSGILQDKGGEDASSSKKFSLADWAAISGVFVASKDKGGDNASRKKYPGADWAAISSALLATKPTETEIDFTENVNQPPQLEQVIVDAYRDPAEQAHLESTINVVVTTIGAEDIQPESSKTWEILKSIVYGGLAESIASLSVVTSAASADATTLNIVALALANLVGGLFILFHNLWELKSEQPRRSNYSETNAAKDRYYELLGKKNNFFLHVIFAVFSFILFGLVPPLVYGFSFQESGEKDFKLAAVAGASLLCITLLAIAKAYIQRPAGYLTYFKTVLFYVSTGAMASIVSYLAGDLIKKLIEKLGWFESSSDFALLLPEMTVGKQPWGSY